MTTLQVLMPMGGLGQRFKAVGIQTPKPLIDVLGTPMFVRALESFDSFPGEIALTVVIRKDHDLEYNLGARVSASFPKTTIVTIDRNTRGAAETALCAQDVLDPALPLVIMDCDIAFESQEYVDKICHPKATPSAGILLSFTSDNPRYSYARIDDRGLVTETAEKKPITSNALMGAYFFRKTETFIDAAHALLLKPIGQGMPEYYMSLVFNEMLDQGLTVELAKGYFHSFGTPEELMAYVSTSTNSHRKQTSTHGNAN